MYFSAFAADQVSMRLFDDLRLLTVNSRFRALLGYSICQRPSKCGSGNMLRLDEQVCGGSQELCLFGKRASIVPLVCISSCYPVQTHAPSRSRQKPFESTKRFPLSRGLDLAIDLPFYPPAYPFHRHDRLSPRLMRLPRRTFMPSNHPRAGQPCLTAPG